MREIKFNFNTVNSKLQHLASKQMTWTNFHLLNFLVGQKGRTSHSS